MYLIFLLGFNFEFNGLFFCFFYLFILDFIVHCLYDFSFENIFYSANYLFIFYI